MRRKYTNEFLNEFCEENKISLREDYSNEIVTGKTIIIAKCTFCNDDMVKKFSALVISENFGCEEHSKKIMIERAKATNLKKYGVENPAKTEKAKLKMIATKLERYGNKDSLENQKINEKRKATNKERYGYENNLQDEGVKQQIKATNLIKYGNEHNSRNEEVKEKRKATNMKNTGAHALYKIKMSKKKLKPLIEKNSGLKMHRQAKKLTIKGMQHI